VIGLWTAPLGLGTEMISPFGRPAGWNPPTTIDTFRFVVRCSPFPRRTGGSQMGGHPPDGRDGHNRFDPARMRCGPNALPGAAFIDLRSIGGTRPYRPTSVDGASHRS